MGILEFKIGYGAGEKLVKVFSRARLETLLFKSKFRIIRQSIDIEIIKNVKLNWGKLFCLSVFFFFC